MSSSFLQMSPWKFDQSAKGWRILSKRGHHREAAIVIVAYISHYYDESTKCFMFPHKMEGEPNPHVGLLWFHAGQMYAYAGQNADSLHAFTQAITSGWPLTAGPGWSEYASAHVAFLKGDVDALDEILKMKCANYEIVIALHKAAVAGCTDYKRTLLDIS